MVPRGGIAKAKWINILRLRGSLNFPTGSLEFSSRVIHVLSANAGLLTAGLVGAATYSLVRTNRA
jgi:hypothetical protein